MIELTEGSRGTLEGTIASIRWRDARNGRTIADLNLPDGRRFPVIGVLSRVEAGQEVVLAGAIERDQRFGLQFRIEGQLDPQVSAEVAHGYLASGLVAHVGPATARTIVDAFGADTLRVLLCEPERLTAFRGITLARLPAVRKSIRETIELAPVVGLLDPFGVSLRICRRILRRYGAAAGETIAANPWRLAKEIVGVGFTTADKVALGLGRDPECPERVEAGILQALRDAASTDGHIVLSEETLVASTTKLLLRALPDAALTSIADAAKRLVEAGELIATDEPPGYALPQLAAAEQLIAARIRRLINWRGNDRIEVSDTDLSRIEESEHIQLDDSQRAAVIGSFTSRVSIITGPPGTGKTTIVRAILDIADANALRIALASPTGRAAKRMTEATGRQAKTIHRYLRYHPELGWQGPTDTPDLLVVDEASMLDSVLAARLLSSIPPYARLLLVGDIDQLPAIGPGNVLGDLMTCPGVAVHRLTHIHRTAAGSGVPFLADMIRQGVRPRFRKDPSTGRMTSPVFDGDTTRFAIIDDSMAPADITDETERNAWAAERITAWICRRIAENKERAADIQVLAPMKRYACGTDALNRAIQEVLNPKREGERFLKRDGLELRPGDRILVTANDYDNDLFNGDVGYLRDINPDGSLLAEFDGILRELPAGAGEGWTLAYAVSVHKAQGSEFPIVIVPLVPAFYMLLQRRLIYTAVSRARRTVAIVGYTRSLNAAIGRHDEMRRQTLLRGYLGASDLPLASANTILEDDEELF